FKIDRLHDRSQLSVVNWQPQINADFTRIRTQRQINWHPGAGPSKPRFICVHSRPSASSHIRLNHSRYPTSGARTSLNPRNCTGDSQAKSVFSCRLVLIDRGGTLIAKSSSGGYDHEKSIHTYFGAGALECGGYAVAGPGSGSSNLL